MKILLAADINKTLMNGAVGVVINLEKNLKELGHDVKVLMLSPTNESIQEEDNYCLPSHPSRWYPDIRQTRVWRHPFITEIIEWRPDIIHIHTEGSVARISRSISRKTGAPFVITMHTYYEKYIFHKIAGTKFTNVLFRGVSKFFYRGTKAVTVPSAKGKKLLLSYKVKKPIYIIPNGIEQERFRKDFPDEEKAALIEKLGLSGASGIFVVVSRISVEKKLDEMIEYFGDVVKADSGAALIIAGDGPALEDLKKQVEKSGLSGNILFTGMIDQEDLYRYYKSGIAFLSASDFEMHSLTYLEAITCGLPLLCRDDPCLEGMLEERVNGFAWKTREEFVSGCLSLMRDKTLRERFSAASLEISENFSAKKCAMDMADFYKKFC